jgi:pimeloyl-ACP methyl ester carboxylesterase
VLHGAEDGVSPPRRSEGHMALFPAGTARHIVAGAGHFLPREQPGAVVDALLTLLRTC